MFNLKFTSRMCCKISVYIIFTSMARPSPAKSKSSQGSKAAIPVCIQNMFHLQLLTLLQPGKQYLQGNKKANKGSKATPSKDAVVPAQATKKKPIPQNANKGKNPVAKNADDTAKASSRNLKRKEQPHNVEDESEDEREEDLRNTESEISEDEKETERDRDNDIVEDDESLLTPTSSRGEPGSPPPVASKADTGALKRKKSHTKVSACCNAINRFTEPAIYTGWSG